MFLIQLSETRLRSIQKLVHKVVECFNWFYDWHVNLCVLTEMRSQPQKDSWLVHIVWSFLITNRHSHKVIVFWRLSILILYQMAFPSLHRSIIKQLFRSERTTVKNQSLRSVFEGFLSNFLFFELNSFTKQLCFDQKKERLQVYFISFESIAF